MFAEELKTVASRLVQYCRNNDTATCLDELYAPDAVSVEALAADGESSAHMIGVGAIKKKHEWWYGLMEVHAGTVDGPYLHGDHRFSVIFEIDATNRETGVRSRMKEVAVYTLAAGKIVREEFYYALPSGAA